MPWSKWLTEQMKTELCSMRWGPELPWTEDQSKFQTRGPTSSQNSSCQNSWVLEPRHSCSHPLSGWGKVFSLDQALSWLYLGGWKGDIQGWKWEGYWEGWKKRKNILEYIPYHQGKKLDEATLKFPEPSLFLILSLLIPHSPAQSSYVLVLCQQSGYMGRYYNPHGDF